MWTRHITTPNTIQHSTDEIVSVLATEPDSVVNLLLTPLSDVVFKQMSEGDHVTIVFLTEHNQTVSVTIPGDVASLEARLANAWFAWHTEHQNG